MTFALVQSGAPATQTASGALAPQLPALSTAGTLLIAKLLTPKAGNPFKCQSLTCPPVNPAAAAVGSGGTFAAGTYFWQLTATTGAGETTVSAEVSATVVLNGSANLTWNALPANVTGVNVYRGTASGAENVLVASLGRVAAYTDTGSAGSAGSPPGANTAGVPNTSPGWVWCGTAVQGTLEQCEIWAYPNNPGGLAGSTWSNAGGSGPRGHMEEFSSTGKYQVMELFPGLVQGAGANATPTVTMGNPVGTGELAVALFALHFTVNPVGQSWTTPAGWTLSQSQASSLAQPWASYYRTTAAAGAVSVTGSYSTTTNQDAWTGVLVVFREAASVAARVGCSTSPGTYQDQVALGFTADHVGSMKEFDYFIGRKVAQSAGVVYQTTEGATITAVPANFTDIAGVGGRVHWALKPQRAPAGLAAAQAALDTNLTVVKQAGQTGWTASLWNEYNLYGKLGPFGDAAGSPYGTGNTEATALSNWAGYWASYQPVLAQHGIPAYTKPSAASMPDAVKWLPPAGTVSGVMIDYYYDAFAGKGTVLDASPAPGVPALQDVCDGIVNPNGTVPSPANTAIPLGLGEVGRSAGATPAWSLVVSWSHTSGSTGHVRDFFAARLAAGKQNADILWFEDHYQASNWIHTPGANGEDQTGIQAEIRAWVDSLTVAAATGGSPAVTTTSPMPAATVGVPYSAALAASGGTSPYTWAVTTGGLPQGLALNAATGQVTGTPTIAGTGSFTVTVTDAATLTGTGALTLAVAPAALAIPAQNLPAAMVGTTYAGAATATGGTQPYTWAVTVGVLPTGLALAPATGVISGTPSAAGAVTFTLTVTDHAAATASASFTITVGAAATPVVTTTVLPSATAGTAYTTILAANGGTPPYTWAVTAGSLPPGITLSAGVLSGTPTSGAAGPVMYPFTIQATDTLAATGSAAVVITVYTVIAPPAVKGPWRFLWAAPQPSGAIIGEINQAQNRSVTLRAETGQNHEASFDIDGASPPAVSLIELQTDLQVMFGTQLVFCGRAGATQDTFTAAAHRTAVTAFDYRELLRRRCILPGDQTSWTAVEQATIAWNLIQHTQAQPGGNLGIARGVGQNTDYQRTVTFTTGDYVADDIDSMAGANGGFEWDITPYGAADLRLDVWSPQRGANNGVVLAWGGGRISSIVRTVDPSVFANAVYVTGSSTGTLTAQSLAASDIATRPEGRWDQLITTTYKTQSFLNDWAAQDLAFAQVLTPSYQVTFYPGAWDGPHWLWLGDTVTLQIDSGRLQVNAQLRVVELAFAISPDNVEVLTATIGRIPLRLWKTVPRILRELKYLSTR